MEPGISRHPSDPELCAQKAAAIMVDFCGHFSLSYSEIACPINTGRPVSETGSAQAASLVASILPGVVITLVTTLMLPCVALEYGHSWCAPSARAWATSLYTRQADVEASLKQVTAVSCAQVHFGV